MIICVRKDGAVRPSTHVDVHFLSDTLFLLACTRDMKIFPRKKQRHVTKLI